MLSEPRIKISQTVLDIHDKPDLKRPTISIPSIQQCTLWSSSMLDDDKNDDGLVQVEQCDWQTLSNVERRLIVLYRQLCDQDRTQLRRVTQSLVNNPEIPAGD